MRKNFLLVYSTIFFFSSVVYAQELEKTRLYEIRSNIPVYACDVIGERIYTNNRFEIPPYESRFAVVKHIKNDTLVIRFLKWSTKHHLEDYNRYNKPVSFSKSDPLVTENIKNRFGTPSDKSDTNENDSVAIQRYFLISKNDLDSNCIKVFSKGVRTLVFTMGLVTMPMKIRYGKNFDFQSSISLGTTAGAKMRLSRYNPNYINLLFGASISTINLDSVSTSGKVSGQPLTNIAVFSPSIGIVFEFGKAQVGVFHGWDLLNKSTQSKYEWIYDRKPWISIGFGFSIFNLDSKSNSSRSSYQ